MSTRWGGGGRSLNKKYTYDGIHLSADGYMKWKGLLLPLIKEGSVSE